MAHAHTLATQRAHRLPRGHRAAPRSAQCALSSSTWSHLNSHPTATATACSALHRGAGVSATHRSPVADGAAWSAAAPALASAYCAARRGLRTARPRASAASNPGPAAHHPPRLQTVLDGLDALNSQDPRSVEVDGRPVPYELAYSRWLSDWVVRLAAAGGVPASEELLITARGQHVERWKVPRSSYPEGRASYLKWREDLKKLHAATTCDLMARAGYPEEAIRHVEKLILKRALKETEGQIVEDGLCLVFLERQFAEFLPKLEGAAPAVAEAEAKMVDILRKSWAKMGPLGRTAALGLALGPREAALVGRALAPEAAEAGAEAGVADGGRQE